jgi:hypothetical protein
MWPLESGRISFGILSPYHHDINVPKIAFSQLPALYAMAAGAFQVRDNTELPDGCFAIG